MTVEAYMKPAIFLAVWLLPAGLGFAQTTRPTPRPSSDDALRQMSAEDLTNKMLQPTTQPSQVLEPVEKPTMDRSSGGAAVAPQAPQVNLLREGTFIIDRLCRLSRNDKGQAELTFEADGKALRDPPMLILPNLTLQQMEEAVSAANRDLKFRVTGMVTEYRGRNYILLQRIVVPSEMSQQF